MKKSKNNKILDFLAEAGILKRVKRSGWWMIGIPHEESVADHSFRCAALGYILAKMEKADPYRVLLMTLFNDLHESRIGDLHKVAHSYLNVREAEKKVFAAQMRGLGAEIGNELRKIRTEHDRQLTAESLISRDADILECLLQAKEYKDMGFETAEKFFKSAPARLHTKSARRLWKEAKNWDSTKWWDKLEKFER